VIALGFHEVRQPKRRRLLSADIEREVLPIDGLCWTAMSRQPMTVATSTALGGSGTLDIRYLVTSCMKNVIAQ
jgi:hypothetical protein